MAVALYGRCKISRRINTVLKQYLSFKIFLESFLEQAQDPG
jgi:hypothetical protein